MGIIPRLPIRPQATGVTNTRPNRNTVDRVRRVEVHRFDRLVPQLRLTRPVAQVERLHEDGEGDGSVDERLVDVHIEAFSDQRRTDQHQEREREHLHRRMLLDERRDDLGGEEHDADGQHHRRDHDVELIDHADRGDDGIEREHDIEQQNLHDDCSEGGRLSAGGVVFRTLEPLMDLGDRLINEERPTEDENQVAPAELERAALLTEPEQWVGQSDDPGCREQQANPHEHRERQPENTSPLLLLLRQLAREDRDEHDVVDAQHELENKKGEEGDPEIRARKKVHEKEYK